METETGPSTDETETGIFLPPERVLGLALQPGAWEGVRGEVTRAA